MMKLNTSNKQTILTSSQDDILYEWLIKLLQEVKLVRGADELIYTLRNHPKIRNYCTSKQIAQIEYLEESYFNPDGTLDREALESTKTHLH